MQLCDRFLSNLTTTTNRVLGKTKGHHDWIMESGLRAVTQAVQLSEKIIFTPSTMHMLADHLQHFEETVSQVMAEVETLDMQAVIDRVTTFRGGWIQFATPIEQVTALLVFVPSVYLNTGKDAQQMYLISQEAEIVDVLQCPQPGTSWHYVHQLHRCPRSQCQWNRGVFLPCDLCRARLVTWGQIMALSAIIAGQYLASARYEEQAITGTRRVLDQKSGKIKERYIPVKHIFKVIDASEIIVPVPVEPPTSSSTREKDKRGESWVDDTTIYEEIRTRPFTRTYRSERYVNVRGQTITFPDGVCRLQPRKPESIGKHITKVKASLYEEGEREERRPK